MKNKQNLKKYIMISFFTIIIFYIFLISFNKMQYRKQTENINMALDNIIEQIIKKYPEVNKNDIIDILNQKNLEKTNFLESYGINLKNDSAILANEKILNQSIIINVIILIGLATFLLVIFLRYNQKKDKELQKITNYIEQINQKNYQLDIEENTEDELSILKNEIYKTTVMLKEQAEKLADDKIKLKDSLSNISHQLKTPLTSITIMLDNILDDPNMSVEVRNEFIKDIHREISNINFLVQTLLKLSRFDANTIVFQNQEVKIEEIIKEAVKNISSLCDLKDIKIIIKGDKQAKINCDKKWQVEAITNILKNCSEHSEKHTQIKIYYEENKMYAKVVIQDNGVGIEEKELQYIFQRFYKGKNASKDSIGIGLALAKTIIEQNNGYITVESKIGEGTIFSIRYMK